MMEKLIRTKSVFWCSCCNIHHYVAAPVQDPGIGSGHLQALISQFELNSQLTDKWNVYISFNHATHDITLSVHLTVLYFPISNNTRVVLQTYVILAGFSQGRQLLYTMRLAAHNMVMLLPLLLMVSWVPSLVHSHGEVWVLACWGIHQGGSII